MASTDPLDQIDALLGELVASGWDDDPKPAAPPEYPPLPTRDGWGTSVVAQPEYKAEQKRKNKKAAALAAAVLGVDGVEAFPAPRQEARDLAATAMVNAGMITPAQALGMTDGDEDEPPPADKLHGLFDIGLLSDLAAGRKGAVEVAEAAGVSTGQVQSALATALRDVDPKEIAKAMGLQAAEQQLKSGALYGVVLHTLVQDMMFGKLSPMAKLELAKLLANVGKIMPKEDKSAQAGSGFVLNISMGGPPQPITIDAN